MVTAQFMVILDSSIVNVALPTIQRSLNFSAVGIASVITAYAAAFGGALILGGRISDLLGHRRIFITGLLAFALTSLACALANSPLLLVVFRVTQGLSAALLAPAALALLMRTFAEGAARNRALGVFGAATSLGFVTGQILGGALVATVGWRSLFLINIPVALVAAALTKRTIAPGAGRKGGGSPDILGAGLIMIAVAMFVWAPAAGAEYGWTSARCLAPIACAVVLTAIFVAVEQRIREPLVRLSMLRSRWLAGTTVATAITGANGAVVLLCTLYLQRVHHYSPLLAGLAFVPTGFAGLITGMKLAGPLLTRFGARAVLSGAPLLSAVAVLGLSHLPSAAPYYLPLLPWLVVIGFSSTVAAVATTVAVSTGVSPGEQGMAAALRQTAFQLGVALGFAVFLAIAAAYSQGLVSDSPAIGRGAALVAGYRLSLVILAALSSLSSAVTLVTLRVQPAHSYA